MSDTDDTDALLLIPSDFFFVHSDSDESYNDINHDHCDSHCTAVDTLISQVYKLETRINKIENISENSHFSSLSSNSTFISNCEMSDDFFKNQDWYSSDYMPLSAKSTPQKPRSKLGLGSASLPTTPSIRHRRPVFRSKINRTSPEGTGDGITVEKKQDSSKRINNREILTEIDKFLNSVKTIQTIKSDNNLQEETAISGVKEVVIMASPIKFDKPAITISELSTLDESTKRFSNLNLNDVNRLLEAIETQQQQLNHIDDHKMESLYENKSFTVQDSPIQRKDVSTTNLENFTNTESPAISKTSWKCGDNINSVPNLRLGMRDSMYTARQSADDILVKQSKTRNAEGKIQKKSDSFSDSEISEPTVFEAKKYNMSSSACANRTDDSNKPRFSNQTSKTSYKNITFNECTKESDGLQSLPSNLSTYSLQQFSRDSHPSIPNINLFSLTDIWNTKSGQDNLISDNEVRNLLPKLEEEKCRRKHCEKLISELQMKILEMQQRLAVAIQLDCAKDEAILRFHEAWEKVATRWKSLENERNSLANKLVTIEEKSVSDLSEANQKVVHFEVEISKALDLAHNNQEKCNNLEKDREELLKKIKQVAIQLKSSQESNIAINKQKEDLNTKISQLEKESLNDKKLLLDSQEQISKTKNSISSAQSQISLLKNENIILQNKLKDCQSLVRELETQKNNLNISIESLQKNEETLRNEIKTTQDAAEHSKTELRNFYQQQVEVLVKDKLKEFQQQLEQAEKALKDELHNKEQNMAKQTSKQMHRLSEKHRLEIHLIEEKHKEHIRLHDLQNSQMKQQVAILQNKLEGYHARQSNIAKELHHVMEAQWIEALRIINSTKSPVVEKEEKSQKGSKTELNSSNDEINKMLTLRDNITTSTDPLPELPKFNFKEHANQIKLRTRHTISDQAAPISSNYIIDMFETPVSSKTQKKPEPSQLNETELQQYIREILEKLPKNSDNSVKQDQRKEFDGSQSQESSSSDLTEMPSTWQQVPLGRELDRSNPTKDRSNKPPWK